MTEATISTLGEELWNGRNIMFLAAIADSKTATSWGEGKSFAKAHPESAFGWVLSGCPWALVDVTWSSEEIPHVV